MEEPVANYLDEILPKKENWIHELEEQAKKDDVPIMDSVGIHFVLQLIQMTKPKKILEIGTAIGYSALRMLEAYPHASIVTIERDEIRYNQATRNINRLKKESQIKVIYGDALDVLEHLNEEHECFDFIFIDAAKGQYKGFLELSIPLLKTRGLIISDNVLFRGYVANSIGIPKRYRKMVEKLKEYNNFLMNHPELSTSIIPIGDGVAVSLKNERGLSS